MTEYNSSGLPVGKTICIGRGRGAEKRACGCGCGRFVEVVYGNELYVNMECKKRARTARELKKKQRLEANKRRERRK